MTRKRYSAEFKREAVAMARSPGVTLKQVGEDLGISAHLLGRWRKLLDEDGAQAFPGHGHARDEQLMQLKRELARVKKERDFLKEAAAFFARTST